MPKGIGYGKKSGFKDSTLSHMPDYTKVNGNPGSGSRQMGKIIVKQRKNGSKK